MREERKLVEVQGIGDRDDVVLEEVERQLPVKRCRRAVAAKVEPDEGTRGSKASEPIGVRGELQLELRVAHARNANVEQRRPATHRPERDLRAVAAAGEVNG